MMTHHQTPSRLATWWDILSDELYVAFLQIYSPLKKFKIIDYGSGGERLFA